MSTDVSEGSYEIKLWDGAGLKTFDDALIKAFEKEYPNIKITATYDPDNTSQQNGPRIISASETPDIARITDMNSAVRGNHVTNLDEYAKAYDWELPDSQVQVYRASSDGKVGSGSLYAVPDAVSMTGLFWNKGLAKQLGINEAPTSIDELVQDMQIAKDAGELGMMMPAKDGVSYMYQAIQVALTGREKVKDWIVQKDGATFNTKGAVEAGDYIRDWQEKGYFPTDTLALDVSTGMNRFSKGEGLFFPAGSWYIAAITKALGNDAGWLAFPGMESGDDASAAMNAVTPFGIPANAKNKNAAAAFLDFLQSDTARKIAVDNGYPPIGEGTMPTVDDSLLTEGLHAYESLMESGNTTDFINNATAGMQASALIPGFQQLIDGTMTSQQFVDSVQKQYESEIK